MCVCCVTISHTKKEKNMNKTERLVARVDADTKVEVENEAKKIGLKTSTYLIMLHKKNLKKRK